MKKKLVALFLVLAAIIFFIGFYGFRGFDDNVSKEVQNTLSEQTDIEENFQAVIPEEFPESFPIYPNSRVKDSWKTQKGAVLGMSVVWTTDDSIADINNFFKEKFDEKGWKYQEVGGSQDSFTMSVEKGKTTGFVGVTKEGEQQLISVTLGIESIEN